MFVLKIRYTSIIGWALMYLEEVGDITGIISIKVLNPELLKTIKN